MTGETRHALRGQNNARYGMEQSNESQCSTGGGRSRSDRNPRRGGRRGRRTGAMIRIANERIERLFELAELEVFSGGDDPIRLTRGNRYVYLARKIGMRYNVRIPKRYKRRFCKHCYHYLVPGLNARVRTRKHKIIIFCEDCKKYTRIPFYSGNP